MAEQNYKNHTRLVPSYHFGAFWPLLAAFVWAAYRLTQGVTGDKIVALVLSVGLLMLFVSIRGQILRVQDRLIRLEMRLRMRETLPEDVAAQAAAKLSTKQLVALRFAGDGEFLQLVKDVLEGIVTEPTEIKKRITDWQGDHLRA